jgi:hemerythrin
MALTTWNDSYSVKDEKLDAQHKNVFEMINNLADAMRKGQGATALEPTLTQLTKHLRIHIQDEENMMRRCNYPELAAHQKEHQSYLLRVEKLKTYLEETGNEDTVSLLHLLRELILDHMLRTDLACSDRLNANDTR